ncbi:uncharacterized protein CC84DRAFT_1163936 [Paraphaeosphaeria sporulosa]|uniref:DUF4185 domain-containing protein n=1 Tax=Paraphaeosphaeria sporulosa TaxID=1460663 RepID=A0A177CEY7_9PLEO|nr:uncharacterized protein CC84DRAFT_1163936 [Paraphaeosphaeria sporulosa]OAG05378.1 hypothetical protein CC84DRAFT_1163936 [Paraphaeosphaeria sporulosa]
MNGLKNVFTKLSTNFYKATTASDERPADVYPSVGVCSKARIAWPPRLTCAPRVLGEVKDESGRHYPRDLGRSVELGGHHYYIFGDTFCFNNEGDFVGVTNNSIALIPDLNAPTKSRYYSPEAKVPEFVRHTAEERRFCERPENIKDNRRLVTWSFGGIIKIPGSEGREGWLFFDPVETLGGNAVRQTGVGVARVKVTAPDGKIECERVGQFPLFPADGPLWGNMSNISAPDGWTYLLSGKGLDNYMARIRTDDNFADAANYQFLKKNGKWESTYTEPHGPFGELAHDVLCGQGQGAIIHLPDFSPLGKEYLWFGCEKFMTSKLYVGAAPRPEGPWEVHSLGEMPKITEQAKTRYCIYPHIWGSDLSEGKILITWSDDGTMGGKVAAGIFEFAMD